MPSKIFEITEFGKKYTVNVLIQESSVDALNRVSITYARGGQIHRENDLPAIIKFRYSGKINISSSFEEIMNYMKFPEDETWVNKGLTYRENDKPVIIMHDTLGNKYIEQWGYGTKTINVVHHRIYGPASILNDQELGLRKVWAFNGKIIPDEYPRMDDGKFIDKYEEIDFIKTTMNFSREYGLLMWEQYVKLNKDISK